MNIKQLKAAIAKLPDNMKVGMTDDTLRNEYIGDVMETEVITLDDDEPTFTFISYSR